MCHGGMHGRDVCVVGGGHAWQGTCMVGACVVGGVHGREGMYGRAYA